MGSVMAYETDSGRRYRVLYRRPDHKQTSKRGFKTKREAELFLAGVEVRKASGDYIDPASARSTVATLGTAWLANQTHLKASSLRPVEIAWRLYVEPKWGNRQVGQLQHSEIQSWVSELSRQKSATTVLRAYGVLAAVLDVAVRDRRLSSNPSRGINLPRKLHREHRYLSHLEVTRLAKASGTRETLVYFLAYTGLRWGEAIGLRVKDISFTRSRLQVVQNAVEVGNRIVVGSPKSHKRRSVALPSFLLDPLRTQCGEKDQDDLVFGDKNGDHLRRTRVSTGSRSWFKTALTEANLGAMTLHDLRHTAASLAISSGANVKAVQKMLGHASAAMTLDTYADLFDDDLDGVAVALHAAKIAADSGADEFNHLGNVELN